MTPLYQYDTPYHNYCLSQLFLYKMSIMSDLLVLSTELFAANPTKSQRTQLKIIESAIKLFVRNGFYETTHDQIAKASKVSRPLVLHYFPARSDLFEFCIRYIRVDMQSVAVNRLAKGKNAAEMLRLYVLSTFEWLNDKRPHAILWLLFYYRAAVEPQYLQLNTELVQMGERRIEQMLRLGVEQKIWKIAAVESTAKAIQNTITGYLVGQLTEKPNSKRKEAATIAYQQIEKLLN